MLQKQGFYVRGENNVPLYIGPICAKVSNVTRFSEEVKIVSAYGQGNKKKFDFFPILLANAPNLVEDLGFLTANTREYTLIIFNRGFTRIFTDFGMTTTHS